MATALITGASAGLGAEFARQLASDGYDLVLVARRAALLDALAEELREAHQCEVEVLAADLADLAETERVARRLADQARPVDVLINNAGFGVLGAVDGDNAARHVEALHVMVRATLMLSNAAAAAMKERGHGALLNVASIAGLLRNGAYASHKEWVIAYSESLRGELYGTGVTVTVTLPGLVHTSFHDEPEYASYHDIPEVFWLTPQTAVAESLRAMKRGRRSVIPSVRYRVLAVVLRATPRWLSRVMRSRKLDSSGKLGERN